ncbi:MAG: hypothetical protein RIE53_02505 [Rhodothermales bacterium]
MLSTAGLLSDHFDNLTVGAHVKDAVNLRLDMGSQLVELSSLTSIRTESGLVEERYYGDHPANDLGVSIVHVVQYLDENATPELVDKLVERLVPNKSFQKSITSRVSVLEYSAFVFDSGQWDNKIPAQYNTIRLILDCLGDTNLLRGYDGAMALWFHQGSEDWRRQMCISMREFLKIIEVQYVPKWKVAAWPGWDKNLHGHERGKPELPSRRAQYAYLLASYGQGDSSRRSEDLAKRTIQLVNDLNGIIHFRRVRQNQIAPARAVSEFNELVLECLKAIRYLRLSLS